MLKHHWRLILGFERIGDNLLILVAFFLTYELRDYILLFARERSLVVPEEFRVLGPLKDYVVIPALALPVFNGMLSLLGAYRSMRRSSLFDLLRTAGFSAALVFLSVSALLYTLKFDLSRSFLGIFCAMSGLLLFLERFGVLLWLRYFRVRGKNFRNLLLVGTGNQAQRLYGEILRQPELGLRVVGFVSLETTAPDTPDDEMGDNPPPLPMRVIATHRTFERTLKRHAVDEVIFTDIGRYFDIVEELAEIAAEEGVNVTIAADLFSLELVRSDLSFFGGIPLVHYRSSPAESSSLLVKRLLDITVTCALIAFLSPLFLAAAVLIKLDSAGPVFFRQRRVGLNGRPFTLLKFRSMVDGAQKLLPTLRERNEMRGPVFKMKDDPRVTRIGRLLRRYSIDELPQLINVLKGDMSLVGPRPPLPSEVRLYERKQRRRLSMRPGLTCTWQVSGRNDIPDFNRWAELDLEYIDNWSLLNDVKLILRTIPAVFTGSGAR